MTVFINKNKVRYYNVFKLDKFGICFGIVPYNSFLFNDLYFLFSVLELGKKKKKKSDTIVVIVLNFQIQVKLFLIIVYFEVPCHFFEYSK